MGQAPAFHVIIDFAQPDISSWFSIDDVVMGGVSRSAMRLENGRAVFEGVVSLERGGGFASVRSAQGLWDLGIYDGIEVAVRGDGHRYKLRLKTDPGLDSVNWQAHFDTEAGKRQNIRLPFHDFEPVYRGRRVNPPLNAGRIVTLGFLISDMQPVLSGSRSNASRHCADLDERPPSVLNVHGRDACGESWLCFV